MPRNLVKERHVALDMDDWVCCHGSCSQGRTCPRYRDITSVSASWFWSTCAVALCGVAGLAILAVFG